MSDDDFGKVESTLVNIFLMLVLAAIGLVFNLLLWILRGSDGSTEDSTDDNNSDGNNSDNNSDSGSA